MKMVKLRPIKKMNLTKIQQVQEKGREKDEKKAKGTKSQPKYR